MWQNQKYAINRRMWMWKFRNYCGLGIGHEVKGKKRLMYKCKTYSTGVFECVIVGNIINYLHFLLHCILFRPVILFLMVIVCSEYKNLKILDLIVSKTQISKASFRFKQKTSLSETEQVNKKTSRMYHIRAL